MSQGIHAGIYKLTYPDGSFTQYDFNPLDPLEAALKLAQDDVKTFKTCWEAACQNLSTARDEIDRLHLLLKAIQNHPAAQVSDSQLQRIGEYFAGVRDAHVACAKIAALRHHR